MKMCTAITTTTQATPMTRIVGERTSSSQGLVEVTAEGSSAL